jgi:hypothetical protein
VVDEKVRRGVDSSRFQNCGVVLLVLVVPVGVVAAKATNDRDELLDTAVDTTNADVARGRVKADMIMTMKVVTMEDEFQEPRIGKS